MKDQMMKGMGLSYQDAYNVAGYNVDVTIHNEDRGGAMQTDPPIINDVFVSHRRVRARPKRFDTYVMGSP